MKWNLLNARTYILLDPYAGHIGGHITFNDDFMILLNRIKSNCSISQTLKLWLLNINPPPSKFISQTNDILTLKNNNNDGWCFFFICCCFENNTIEMISYKSPYRLCLLKPLAGPKWRIPWSPPRIVPATGKDGSVHCVRLSDGVPVLSGSQNYHHVIDHKWHNHLICIQPRAVHTIFQKHDMPSCETAPPHTQEIYTYGDLLCSFTTHSLFETIDTSAFRRNK